MSNLPAPDLADFPVALLAGGFARRLGPLTAHLPKALVPVAGEPFLAHQLRLLRGNGLRRIILCTGHLGEMIQAQFGDGAAYGVRLEYSFDGPRLLGTGGAIKRALPLLGEEFAVLYADAYLPMDYAAAIRAFRASGQPGLLTVFHRQGHAERGRVIGEDGLIRAYDQLPTTAAVAYGMGVLCAEALGKWPNDEPFDLTDIYRALSHAGRLAGLPVDSPFYEIGSPAGICEAESMFKALDCKKFINGHTAEPEQA